VKKALTVGLGTAVLPFAVKIDAAAAAATFGNSLKSSLTGALVEGAGKIYQSVDEDFENQKTRLQDYDIGEPYIAKDESEWNKLSDTQKEDKINQDNLRVMNFILENQLYNKINYKAYCQNLCEPFIPRFTIVTINISRLSYNRTKNIVNVHNIKGMDEIYNKNNVLFSKNQLNNSKPVVQPIVKQVEQPIVKPVVQPIVKQVEQPLQQLHIQLQEQKESQQQMQQQLKQILQILQQKL
jgi:hypothetical protein